MIHTFTLRTGELRPGDIVHTWGMRVRIDSVRPYHPHGKGCISSPDGRTSCGLAWSCLGTVINLDEVRAAGIVPMSWLCRERYDGHRWVNDRSDVWHVQGNMLATWPVEVRL